MVKARPEDPAALTHFKVLTFDVYSTLIDEPGGMYAALLPLLSQLPDSDPHKYDKGLALSAFSKFERELQTSQPNLEYNLLLSQAYALFATSLSLPPPSLSSCTAFGSSIPSWPAFPDTVAALQALGKRYKLVILSNIDNASIQATIAGPLHPVRFDAVYTAQEIGSYKPSLHNFEYLISHLGQAFDIQPHEILHTAQSLRCDHVPAKRVGVTSVWIDRQAGGDDDELETYRGEVAFTWRFGSMGEMASAVEEAFLGEE